MASNFETVTVTARNYADDVKKKLPVTKAILFGSYAKGTATELSDIDICFFLDSFNGKGRIDIITELLGIAGKYKGVFFEPIAFPVSEVFGKNRQLPLLPLLKRFRPKNEYSR